jgi:alpha-tubulin suppressor-like RCC1 family protein
MKTSVRIEAPAGHQASRNQEVAMQTLRLARSRVVSVLVVWASLASGCACESVVSVTPRDAGRPDAYRPASGAYDECGNGLDDDGDGAIDEDCPCGTGETQPCWDGDRAARGVGVCGDGTQQCSATGSNEFGNWLSCAMSRGPGTESCEGRIDEDCDGAVDEGCPCSEGATRACAEELLFAPCSAGTQACRGGTWTLCEGAVGPVAEVCGNGLDDDCDGMSDDPSFCACSPAPEVCGNGLDDDCDGETDESPCAAPMPDAGASDAGLDGSDAAVRDGCLPGDPLVEISVGGNQSCARRSCGSVLCWGFGWNGELGDGMFEGRDVCGSRGAVCRATPRPVLDLSDAIQISAGDTHTCALRPDHTVACWGRNLTGQLGNGACSGSEYFGCLPSDHGGAFRGESRPVTVSGLGDALEVSAGDGHTCALHRDGRVSCWGDNRAGQLGDGTTVNRVVPTLVGGLTDAVAVSAGAEHTCALRRDGSAVCWGRNDGGQLGDNTTVACSPSPGPCPGHLVPTPVVGLSNAVEIGAGSNHTCARRGDGRVACWGLNLAPGSLDRPFPVGWVGDGTTENRAAPTAVIGITDAAQLEVSGSHSCVRRETGTLVCWGNNSTGGLGDNTTTNRLVPTPVYDPFGALSDIAEIAVGQGFTCARRTDNRLFCWGRNDIGTVGDGTYLQRLSATPVVGL